MALDLLLGTQGWRRFVEKTLERAAAKKAARTSSSSGWSPWAATANPPAMFDNLGRIASEVPARAWPPIRPTGPSVLNTLIDA